MVTVVNNPSSGDGDSGMGFLIGVILLLIMVLLFVYYGVPALRSVNTNPQINVPEQIDVNINQGQ